MHVLHISFECYPYAKVGGMADVVGALPKYQRDIGAEASVIMPRFERDWDKYGESVHMFHGSYFMDWQEIHYDIYRIDGDFPVYTVDIPGKLDRPGVYSYGDDLARLVSFQRSVVHWLRYDPLAPDFDILHCHDHHTGLIPFFARYCPEFYTLRSLPTFFTIHNAAYQGVFGWNMRKLLPAFPDELGGLIEWNNAINPFAAAIKCAWHFNAVSEGYLNELFGDANGLEGLISSERHKASGIINGIDKKVWDPKTDPFLPVHLKRSVDTFKRKNKEDACAAMNINPEYPLYLFIGRLAYEKGADMLPSIVGDFVAHYDDVNWALLGTGEGTIESQLRFLEHTYPERVKSFIMYNEELAHRLYAASDFLIMPSRVEPCGLNQMYSMGYGGIPIVRSTGGLKDTVEPLHDGGGNGYAFHDLEVNEIRSVLSASRRLYAHKEILTEVRKRNVAKDFSWQNSARKYLDTYQTLM